MRTTSILPNFSKMSSIPNIMPSSTIIVIAIYLKCLFIVIFRRYVWSYVGVSCFRFHTNEIVIKKMCMYLLKTKKKVFVLLKVYFYFDARINNYI